MTQFDDLSPTRIEQRFVAGDSLNCSECAAPIPPGAEHQFIHEVSPEGTAIDYHACSDCEQFRQVVVQVDTARGDYDPDAQPRLGDMIDSTRDREHDTAAKYFEFAEQHCAKSFTPGYLDRLHAQMFGVTWSEREILG